MIRLKIGIKQVDNIVFGRVLEQDKELCNLETVAENSEFGLTSDSSPELLEDVLCLRGAERDKDNDWFALAYEDVEEARQAVRNIKELVAEVNGKTVQSVTDHGLEVIE